MTVPFPVALLLVVATGVGTAVATLLAMRRAIDRLRRSHAAAREEERAAYLGTVATGLAHELRNPLSTMEMHLQLLEEEWGRPITEREERGHKRVKVLLRETERLETILDGFLKFAMDNKLNLEDVHVGPLVRELAEFVQPRFDSAGVALRAEAPEGLPPLRADGVLLRQAVLNLLLNALEATPKGGSVTLSAASEEDRVVLSVTDTGRGIPAGAADKMFELYYSTKPSGTGLGLPMARKIVEEHGGTIEADAPPGGGARFAIRLPTR